jgi:hypothetical protein
MSRITVLGAGLALLAQVAAADAQGIGYGPGVNPSNPQDMTHRSNPQDLLAPGGYNRQDLVRPPPRVNAPVRAPQTSAPASRSVSPALRYTAKAKPETKAKPKAKSKSMSKPKSKSMSKSKSKPKPKPKHPDSAAQY